MTLNTFCLILKSNDFYVIICSEIVLTIVHQDSSPVPTKFSNYPESFLIKIQLSYRV